MHHRTSGRRGFSSTTRRLRVVPRPPSCSPASLIYNYSYISWYTNWQTHCHLRGNFLCLGEERATKKGTEPLADTTARLLGMRGTAPRPRGSSGMLSSQAFFSHLLHRRLRGGSSWRTAPSAPSPREQPCCRGGTMQRTATQPGTNAMVRRLHPPSG